MNTDFGSFVVCLTTCLELHDLLFCSYQDVHDRFRTESHSKASGLFNERFLLSLASCKACVVMDDELNILPISSHIRSITQVPTKEVNFIADSHTTSVPWVVERYCLPS